MLETPYRKYLDGSPEETQGSALGFVLKAGAIAGAAYGFHRLGGTSLIAKYAVPALAGSRRYWERAGAFGGALSETFKHRSILSAFKDDTIDSFARSYADRVSRTEAFANRSLATGPTEIVRKRLEIMSMKGALPFEIAGELHFRNVIDTLNRNTSKQIYDALLPVLSDTSRAHLSYANEDIIAQIVKRANLTDNLSEEAGLALLKAIKANENTYYSSVNEYTISFGMAERDVRKRTLQHAVSSAVANLESGFRRSQKLQDTFYTRVLERAGYRQATVEDFLKHNLFETTERHLVKKPRGKHYSENVTKTVDWDKKFRAMAQIDPEVLKYRVDPNIFIDESGKIFDLRHIPSNITKTMDVLANNFQIPIVNINPLRLFHWITTQGAKNAPFSEILKRGTIQPVLSGNTQRLSQSYFAVGSKIYDLTTGDLVRDNIVRYSGRFGLVPRLISSMAGLERSETAITRKRAGWVRNFLDIGIQETQSDLQKVIGVFTKFHDPKWARNKFGYLDTYRNILQVGGEGEQELLIQAYKTAYNLINQKTGIISNEGIEKLASIEIRDATGKLVPLSSKFGLTPQELAIRDNDELMKVVARLVSKDAQEGITAGSPALGLLTNYLRAYTRDPIKFANSPRVVTSEFPTLPGTLAAFEGEGGSRLVSQFEDVRRALQQHFLYQFEHIFNDTNRTTIGKLLAENLSKQDEETAKSLLVLNRLRGRNSSIFRNILTPLDRTSQLGEEGLSAFLRDITSAEEPWFYDELSRLVQKHTPWWGSGPGLAPPEYFGPVRSLVVNRSVNPIYAINETIRRGGNVVDVMRTIAETTVGQLGWGPASIRAGRPNLDKVSSTTLVNYTLFHRLNEALGKAGLGLSNRSLGSTQDVYWNLITRRLLFPMLAIGYAGYLNYQLDNLTGINIKEELAGAYVGSHLDVARIKDVIGLTNLQKRSRSLHPGVEQLWGTLPGIAANIGTFGLLGDPRSYEELVEYYAYGNEPVRKGRFWPMGSNTPWTGSKVEYHQTNWYRRLMTDYMMSDVMYGSRAEYYANQWYPTLENPLGPITPIIIAPHHWANKHREDRPYPETGGTILEEIPLFGPVLSKLLDVTGIAPNIQRGDLSKAHREYIRDINESVKARAMGGPGFFYGTPVGGWSLNNIFPTTISTAGGYQVAIGGDGGIPVYGGAGADISGTDIYNMAGYNRAELQSINHGIISRKALQPIRLTPQDPIEYFEDLYEVSSPYSPAYRAGETWYSLTEMAGIYGFIATTLTGNENRPYSQNILASSTYMSSFGRRFWDENLGGMGGMVSEIFRRFVPNNKYRRDMYNPYRNQMPEWLPSHDYFIDFLHGDPFCVSKDTLIDVNNGFKCAEDITIGDLILTHKGRRLPVTDIIKRPLRDGEKSYRIKIAGLDRKIPLEFSEEHPILIKRIHKCSFASSCLCRPDVRNYNGYCDKHNCYNKWENAPIEFVEAKDVQVGDAVVFPIPVVDNPQNKISYSYDWVDAPRSPRYIVHEDLNISKDVAWLLGLYCAEGSTTKQNGRPMRLIFSLHSDERDVIDRVCRVLNTEFSVSAGVNIKSNSVDIIVTNAKVARIFDSIIPGDLYSKRINENIFSLEYELRLSFLLGFLLGDGTVQKNTLIGTSANKDMILDFYKLAFGLGIPAQYIERNTRVAYELAIHAFHLSNKDISGLMYKAERIETEFNRQPNILSWSDGKYVYSIITEKEEIDLEYVFGFEVNEDDTFCVIGFATHNTKIPKGEMRLPGAGYERLNSLHPDEFGRYGAFDRFKILADVAPYSEEYTLYKNIVSAMPKTEQMKREFATIKKQVSEVKKKYRVYPYRFKYADVTNEEVHVTRIIDPTTFLTAEYPDHPIRMAGIKVSSVDPEAEAAREEIAKYIYPGAVVKIGLEKDPLKRVKDDVMQTMHATIFLDWDTPLQAKLIRTMGDVVKEKETDFSAVSIRSRFYNDEIRHGALWEGFAHLDTFFHTKFLNIRSPLEMYKRQEVYGKAFQPWYEPWSGILKPTLEAMAAKTPVISATYGGVLGYLFTRNKFGAAIGAITTGTLSTIRVFREALSSETWIPKRRQREREIDEYFDILKYVKYKGLYEKAREVALRKEGVDVEKIIAAQEARGDSNKAQRSRIENIKRWIKISPARDRLTEERNKAILKRLNADLDEIAMDRRLVSLGPNAIQALYYDAQVKSTLYGADLNGHLVNIYRALPKKDREFFQHFINANPEEREEILRLVPRNQRRLYQARWGLEVDERVDLQEYFRTHYLPPSSWIGWRSGVSLDDIKLKVIKNEALDMTEFGFWPDDEKYAASAPELNPFKPSSYGGTISGRLRRVLKGAGLSDIDIRITHGPAAEAHNLNVQVMVEHDIKRDILNIMNSDGIKVI
jgi:hypothetical protein